MELGLEMLNTSLEKEESEKADHAKSRVLIQLVQSSEDKQILKEFQSRMEKPFTDIELYLELCHHAHRYADQIELFEDKRDWILSTLVYWERVIAADEKNSAAWVGIGNAYLFLADEMIQLLEDKDISIPKVQKYLEEALKAFSNALDISIERKEDVTHLYLLMGETQVHLGNLLDKDDEESVESLEYYKKAVVSFQKVQELDKDALPEQFEEFLEEWQQEME